VARFEDRISAAGELLSRIKNYAGTNAVVVGLPRGGMITAAFLAEKSKLPLDFIVVKKVGAPENEEYAIGAVTENGGKYSDERFTRVQKEADGRSSLYRSNYPAYDLKDKTVILADDGIATGTTMLAAIGTARKRGAKKIVVAVPVGSSEAIEKIKKSADGLICVEVDPDLSAVGEYYDSFPQVDDEQVLAILKNAKNNSFNK